MDAIILTREDADRIKGHIEVIYWATAFPNVPNSEDEGDAMLSLINNGSEGVSWISVIPTDTLEYLLAEFTNNSAELDDEGLKLLIAFSSEFHNRP